MNRQNLAIATPGLPRASIGDYIALAALFIALPSFIDYVGRLFNLPRVEVLSPYSIDFRTKALVIRRNPSGELLGHNDSTPVVVKESTELMPTYAVLPVSYINRGDVGEDYLVTMERMKVKINDEVHEFHAAYETMIVPRSLSSWLGETVPRLPASLGAGEVRSAQVVFVKLSDAVGWSSFKEKLNTLASSNGKIEIWLEIDTHSANKRSGKSFRSRSCYVSAQFLINQVADVDDDRSRKYYMGAKCERLFGSEQ